ncbi:peroxisomal biogenesis factor 3 [Musca vetustissima]|uniref:peroxisomal biogenesis factor 3 n=1 Tax=Musca vetustissima TaxID=27455 RepID=UPI002AB61E7E|nr:peroxisomal biogenesis factor 3 [Musca vetustissima]
MLSRLNDFLTRHRRKFIVTGVVVGGSIFLFKYAQNKLVEMQEKQAREFLEKSRRLQHFESTEKTCNQVILGMGAELMQAIIKECSTDELLEQLKQNPPNKLELWEEMKIQSFTRLTTFIYASSMLVVALRIQLNLLGGYLYQDTTTTTDKYGKKKPGKINDDLKQQYLSLIRHFIQEDGLSELVRLIRAKVMAVMRQLPLTKPLSLADIEQLFWSLQMAINSDPSTDPCSKMAKYLLPSQLPDHLSGDMALMQKMFNETLDLLESDEASSVCSNNICRGFSLAVDAMAESYKHTISTNPSNSSEKQQQQPQDFNVNSIQIALARVIPIASTMTAKGFDSETRPQNLATSLLTFYVISDKTKVLGANVYETFSST